MKNANGFVIEAKLKKLLKIKVFAQTLIMFCFVPHIIWSPTSHKCCIWRRRKSQITFSSKFRRKINFGWKSKTNINIFFLWIKKNINIFLKKSGKKSWSRKNKKKKLVDEHFWKLFSDFYFEFWKCWDFQILRFEKKIEIWDFEMLLFFYFDILEKIGFSKFEILKSSDFIGFSKVHFVTNTHSI